MECIRPRFLLAAALMLSGLGILSADAQEVPQSDVPACLVIGDVERPDAYPLPADRVITSGQLANSALPASEEAVVCIIRLNGQLARMTEVITRSQPDSGTPLCPGDVLIVRATSPYDRAVVANAGVQSPAGSLVVTLGEGQITLSDVVAQCGLTVNPAQPPACMTADGLQPATLNVWQSEVRHGNLVVFAATGIHARTSGVAVQPRVSGAYQPQPGDGFNPAADPMPEASAHPNLPNADRTQPVLTASGAPPVRNVPLTSLPIAPEVQLPPESSGMESAADNSIAPAEFASESRQAAQDIFLPRSTEDVTAAVDSDQHFQQTAMDGSSLLSEQADNSAAPAGESDPGRDSRVAAKFGLLNSLFVAGLLLAGGLVIAGWIRSEMEPAHAAEAIPAVSRRSRNLKRESQQVPGDRLTTPTTPATSAPPQPATGMAPEPVTDMTPHAASVDSNDIPPESPDTVRDSAAVITVPNSLPSTEGSEDAAVDQIPAVSEHSSGGVALVSELEWFGYWRQTVEAGSIAEETGHRTVRRSPGRMIPVTAVTQDSRSVEDDLDALIENRLPVDLCRASLPLRVTLFGRPAGPRRLRIDAAHPSVPAPHTRIRPVSNRSGSTGTGSESAASDVKVDAEALQNQLDRALNQLGGQVST